MNIRDENYASNLKKKAIESSADLAEYQPIFEAVLKLIEQQNDRYLDSLNIGIRVNYGSSNEFRVVSDPYLTDILISNCNADDDKIYGYLKTKLITLGFKVELGDVVEDDYPIKLSW